MSARLQAHISFLMGKFGRLEICLQLMKKVVKMMANGFMRL